MKRYLVALLCVMSLGMAQAAEVIKAATSEFPGYYEKDGSGYYLDVLRKIFPAPEYNVTPQYVPFERARSMIHNGSVDILPGTNDLGGPGLLSTQSTDNDVVAGVVMKGKFKDWKGEQSLAGLRAQSMIGYGYDSYTKVKMKYEEKGSLDSMLNTLAAGRIDVILLYVEEVNAALEKMPNKADFQILPALLKKPLYFGFPDNARGQKLRARFDSELAKLKASGELKKIMTKYPSIQPGAFPN